ncbi:MAG: hypothetical protein K8S27_12110 [Candidatus Omnitrophica bacterium]|nr:hypothetical protein [Candidatus Omnitrophota bacterium]
MTTNLLAIHECHAQGYNPIIDYEQWRVAILNYIDELEPQEILKMQRHDETDEVFVLLKGQCLLFLGEGANAITKIHIEQMQPLKQYNVKRGVWHTHSLSRDAMVLIVENRETSLENSPEAFLTPEQRQTIVSLSKQYWPDGLPS